MFTIIQVFFFFSFTPQQADLGGPHLKVIYLHNNRIKEIQNLNKLSQLTHLYLQWNNIEKIDNINELKNLRKLYLSYNRIHRLENIAQLNKLEELYLERQRMDDGEEFTFDADSLIGIGVIFI